MAELCRNDGRPRQSTEAAEDASGADDFFYDRSPPLLFFFFFSSSPSFGVWIIMGREFDI